MTGQSLNYSQLNFLYNLFVIILLAAELNFTPTARCFRGLAVIFTQKRSHVFHAAYRATNSQNYRAFSKKAQKAVYFTQHIGRQTTKITGHFPKKHKKPCISHSISGDKQPKLQGIFPKTTKSRVFHAAYRAIAN